MKWKFPILLAALLFTGADVALAASAVVVKAPVVAPTFVENLDTDRVKVETSLADALVANLRQHFPVLDWQRTPPSHEAELVLTLDERAGAGPKKEVTLRWSGRVGSEDKPLAGLSAIPVYGAFDLARETSDADALAVVLKDKLDAWFRESSNRKEFSKAFMNLVPLAHSIDVDNAKQRLVLPFSMTTAKMGDQSKLVIRFIANAQGTPQSGTINVSNLLETLRASKLNTLATVAVFDFPALPTLNRWDSQIEVVLRGAQQSRVFLDDYVYSEVGGVIDGNAVTP
jgi:hypothetical protein